MENIYVPKNIKKQDINKFLEKTLMRDETIKGTFWWANNNANVCVNALIRGLSSEECEHFKPYIGNYKVLVTNKRLLVTGLYEKMDFIASMKSIQYEDIDKIVMNEIDEISIYTKKCTYYSMIILCLDSKENQMTEAVQAIDYIVYRIGLDKVCGILYGDIKIYLYIWITTIIMMSIIVLGIISNYI